MQYAVNQQGTEAKQGKLLDPPLTLTDCPTEQLKARATSDKQSQSLKIFCHFHQFTPKEDSAV